MILLIDNYDSFTYNLYQYIGMNGADCFTVRNDKFTIREIESMSPEKIVISPGPGIPENAGMCIETIMKFHEKIPILGICLGHQCIGRAFGARVSYAKSLVHGKYSKIHHDGNYILKNMPDPFLGARYHSLAVYEEGLPPELEIFARSDDGEIMAIKHKSYPVYGLQFHPESILTKDGIRIIANFIGNEV
jgi:anthranilate synthase component 2